MQNGSAYTVHLHRDGVLHSFRPGDELPDWAAARITNPLVLVDDSPDEPDEGAPAGDTDGEAIADPGGGDANPDPDADDRGDDADSGRPAENGLGATRDRWEAYAKAQGIEVESTWKREDIIKACVDQGK